MSYKDGWKAINLEMPDRIPRFEPSAEEYHWELINAVCGTELSIDAPLTERLIGTKAFIEAWDYGIYLWSIIGGYDLLAKRTSMGHANYAQHGRDYDDDIYCPFTEVEEVLAFDPWETYGSREHKELVNRFDDDFRKQCDILGDTVVTTGTYVTLMSGMIDIFGWDMLLNAAATDLNGFGEVVNRYAGWIKQFYDAEADCEAEVIYSHDDLVWTQGPFIDPAWYRRYIFPNLEMLWDPLKSNNKKILFVCDGDYTSFLGDIAACGNHGFWFECFTDLDEVCARFGQSHFIVGNGDTRILTFGTQEDIRAEVERCLRAGRGCPGYFMCMSGHIPPNVPVENALYYNEVYLELRNR